MWPMVTGRPTASPARLFDVGPVVAHVGQHPVAQGQHQEGEDEADHHPRHQGQAAGTAPELARPGADEKGRRACRRW